VGGEAEAEDEGGSKTFSSLVCDAVGVYFGSVLYHDDTHTGKCPNGTGTL
jgi:hypothetical protein